jgi:predicted RNA binding protein YcfA (HicA-like mRNA interferase family)
MSRRLPTLKPREVLQGLKRAGFFVHRVSGSHYVLKYPGQPARRVTLPFHTRDLAAFLEVDFLRSFVN